MPIGTGLVHSWRMFVERLTWSPPRPSSCLSGKTLPPLPPFSAVSASGGRSLHGLKWTWAKLLVSGFARHSRKGKIMDVRKSCLPIGESYPRVRGLVVGGWKNRRVERGRGKGFKFKSFSPSLPLSRGGGGKGKEEEEA